ncbi:hypothetical protein C0989_004085, partial [Termitomyces sp. Mn162]
QLVEASLHLSFDRGQWALLPLDEEYITKLTELDFTIENPLEQIYGEEKIFRYAFLPFPTLNWPILRLKEKLVREKISADTVTLHCSPYHMLQPIIKSHIKPHFVIFDLVAKLRRAEANIMTLTENRQHINRATLGDYEFIFDKWMTTEVPSSFKANQTRTEKRYHIAGAEESRYGEEGDSTRANVREGVGSNGGSSGRIGVRLEGRDQGGPTRYKTRSEVKKSQTRVS